MRGLKKLLYLSLLPLCAVAQRSPEHPLDIKDAPMDNIRSFFQSWMQTQTQPAKVTPIDDQFFISRVRPATRITEGDYQLDPAVKRQRKMLLWVPMDDPTSQWKSLPRYCFEGDNFSLWSYVDTHGGWTNPIMRSSAGMSDVAARNGVTVGSVLSVPWNAYISDDDTWYGTTGHSAFFNTVMKKEGDKYIYAAPVVKMMKYYGLNALGFNSEFNTSQKMMDKIIGFFKACHKEAEKIGWKFEVHWYDGTCDYGGIRFDLGLGNHNQRIFGDKDNICSTHLFANYNWNGSTLNSTVEKAKALGRSSFDYYAGFDIQGRALRNYNWGSLLYKDISIGFWGAHSQSLIHQSATDDGTSDIAIQKAYLLKQELMFSGGNHNPAVLPDLKTDCTLANASLEGQKGFHGLAKYLTAKSVIQQVPFVSRFNLGNGLKFYNEGQVTFDHKWFNVATQDIMPTWRWWVTNAQDKASVADLRQFVNVGLTFDDAYFGGSCLQLDGATPYSRVKLFKSLVPLKSTNEFSIIYKTLNGTNPHAKLFVATRAHLSDYKEIALPATQKAGEWTQFKVSAAELGLNEGDKLAMMGLVVENSSDDYILRVGELALREPSQQFSPVAPTIDQVQVLRGRFNACDFKMKYTASQDDSWENKVYNDDVDTWYYEIYFQQQDEQPQLLTATTSWAAYAIDAPMKPGRDNRDCRFGVRAVSPDGQQKSAITWTDYDEVPYNQPLSDVEADRPVIKPNEEFTMGYVDLLAPPAKKWIVRNHITGEVLAEKTNSTQFTARIAEPGVYNLEIEPAQGEKIVVNGKVIISPESTGAVPQVTQLESTATEVEQDAPVSVRYAGRLGEGSVSRALEIKDPNMLRIPGTLQEGMDYSYALWFKVTNFAHDKQGTNLINKNTVADKWPHNNWGDLWVTIRPQLEEHLPNEVSFNTMGWEAHDSPNTKVMTTGCGVQPGVWCHIVVTQNKAKQQKIYFNGKKIGETIFNRASRRAYSGDSRIKKNVVADIYIGGGGVYKAGLNAHIDEVQVWNKALSDAEVLEAMQGYKKGEAPAALQGYYTFEETSADGKFANWGQGGEDATADLVAMVNSGGEQTADASYEQRTAFTDFLGMPSIPGSLEIKTKKTWEVPTGNLQSDDNHVAVFTFNSGGEKSVALTYENKWGKSTKKLENFVTVGIDDVFSDASAAVDAEVLYGGVHLSFAQAGHYDVRIINLQGAVLQQQALDVAAGQTVSVALNGAAGVYLLQVSQNGKTVKHLKLVQR